MFFSLRQVKKSTLNPNAKEFNPAKPLLSVVRGWESVDVVFPQRSGRGCAGLLGSEGTGDGRCVGTAAGVWFGGNRQVSGLRGHGL